MKKFTILIFLILALAVFVSTTFAHHEKVTASKAGINVVAIGSYDGFLPANTVKKTAPTEEQKIDALVASSKEKSAPGDQGKKKKDVIYVYMKAIPEPSSAAYVEMMGTYMTALNGSSPGGQIGGGRYSAYRVVAGTSTIFF